MPVTGENRERLVLDRSKILVVEGQDDKKVVSAILNYLNIADDFQVVDMGGKDRLSPYLQGLPGATGFHQVETLGIIRDADNSAGAAFQSVCSGLLNTRVLSIPKQPLVIADGKPRVAIFLWPDCAKPGTLETLCMASVINHPAIICIDDFMSCVQTTSGEPPKNREKARVQAFLASHAKRTYRTIGDAAQANVWPWNHPVFEPITTFLNAL